MALERSALSWMDRLARKQAYILPDWGVATAPFCTERRLLWLARPGRKALARQAFFGEGREPEIKFNRGLSTAARCCPRLLHLKETWQPRYRQPQAGVSA